jgi:serine/threonine protein kinase
LYALIPQGVLIYEMVFGWPPFYHDDPMKVYAKIISGKISYPDNFSNSMEDIIAKLCTKNPSKRLGNMKGGIADLVKHKWFGSFDWKGLRKGTIATPFVPDVAGNRAQQAEDECVDELVVSSVLSLVSLRVQRILLCAVTLISIPVPTIFSTGRNEVFLTDLSRTILRRRAIGLLI